MVTRRLSHATNPLFTLCVATPAIRLRSSKSNVAPVHGALYDERLYRAH